MTFEIEFTVEALEDIQKLKKTGNQAILKKFFSLIQELKNILRQVQENRKGSNILSRILGQEG